MGDHGRDGEDDDDDEKHPARAHGERGRQREVEQAEREQREEDRPAGLRLDHLGRRHRRHLIRPEAAGSRPRSFPPPRARPARPEKKTGAEVTSAPEKNRELEKEERGLVAAATAAAAAVTTAAAAVFLGLGLIHLEGATVVVAAVQGAHGLLAVFVGHLDEAEALRGAGVAVRDHAGGFDVAEGLKQSAEGRVVHRIGQVSNVELHGDPLLNSRPKDECGWEMVKSGTGDGRRGPFGLGPLRQYERKGEQGKYSPSGDSAGAGPMTIRYMGRRRLCREGPASDKLPCITSRYVRTLVMEHP